MMSPQRTRDGLTSAPATIAAMPKVVRPIVLALFLAAATAGVLGCGGSSSPDPSVQPQEAAVLSSKIDEIQANELVGNFCRSNGGCLRTILWSLGVDGTIASTRLPPEKFVPKHDQTGGGRPVIPLLCQEPCNLLVAEARKVVQAGK